MSDFYFFIAGALVLFAIISVVRRLGNVDGAADWMLAWVAIIGSGIDRALIANEALLAWLTPLWDTAFAALLASGMIRFTGQHRHLSVLWSLFAFVVVVRVGMHQGLGIGEGTWFASLSIGASSIFCCFSLYRYGLLQVQPLHRMLSFAFLLPLAAQLIYAVYHLNGLPVSAGYFAWLIAGTVLCMVKMLLLVERGRQIAAMQAETMAMMAQAAPVGLGLSGADGSVRALNAAARHLLGSGFTEGEPMEQFLQSCTREQVATTEGVAQELRLHSGALIRVQRRTIRTGGLEHGDVWFFEDLRAESRARDIVPLSDRLGGLRTMAGNVAHIFNNQLTVIRGNTDLIRRSGHGDIEAWVSALDSATQRCSEVTRDFLQLAQMSERFEFEPLAVRPTLKEMLSDLAFETKLELEGLPDVSVNVDASSFRRAFEELARNALDAGASTLVVTAEAPEGGFLTLKVSDDGAGIPEAVEGRVFEPFFSTKEQALGSGLGLSLVLGIVNAHGGTVHLNRLSQGVQVATTWPVVGASA